jgi:penicillin-binding protein 1B
MVNKNMARMRRWFLFTAFAVGVTGSFAVLWLDARVRAYLAGPPLGGVRIYAEPTILRPGAPMPPGALGRKLARLGYVTPVEKRPLAAGEFRTGATFVEIAQRISPSPWAPPPLHARVSLRAGRITEIRQVDGGKLDQLELEPEMLAVTGGAGPALGADAEVTPRVCRNAVLAAEDRNFFRHPGVDPVAIIRALVADVRAGAARQGGSTISQQLAKNAFLSPTRTIVRKVKEAVLAFLLEIHATKEEILTRYLSSVYLGVDGGLPVHGFAQAAAVYFGKPVGDLGAAECALLAGIIRSPNGLAPRRHARAAVARRNRVLALMARQGSITDAAATSAAAEPLELAPARARPVAALYVAAQVARELERLLPAEIAEAPGLAVFTAVDADAQREAERAVRKRLSALEGKKPRRDRLQAALVALDVQTGRVRALVGGRDYGSSQLDRAVRARRQPGSAFKPFVYLAALDPDRRGSGHPFTVASMVEDMPIALDVGASVWRPANYDDDFAGRVTLETALAESRNAATVRVALDVGLDAVAQAATDAGLRGPLPRVPSLALGVAETSLLELAAAYGVFASGGLRRAPYLVEGVVSPSGETLYTAQEEPERVLSPDVAFLVTHMLESVIDEGTGRPARQAGLVGAAAGKTGTTDETRDAWFVGYTPETVAGVWVGYDGGGATGFTGAQAALPIWTDFMRATAGRTVAKDFPVPEGIVWREIDPASGGLATSGCPAVRNEPFLADSVPTERCELHGALWTSVGDDIGGAVRGSGRALGAGGRRVRGWFEGLFR